MIEKMVAIKWYYLVILVVVAVIFFFKQPFAVTIAEQQYNKRFSYENGVIRNLRIAFVGDSVTRYQYNDLVTYLHNGTWIENSDTVSPIIEGTFASFQDFFNYTNTALDGTEDCDCYRIGPANPYEIFENHYYNENSNYITLISKYGSFNAIGRRLPAEVYHTNHTFSSEYAPQVWEYNWTGLLQYHIGMLRPKPDFVVLNAGLWPHDLTADVFSEIQDVADIVGIKAIYKTTTSRRDETEVVDGTHDKLGCAFLEYCFNLSWTAGLTGIDNYWDSTHFTASVNRRFNEQLLDLLQNIVRDGMPTE